MNLNKIPPAVEVVIDNLDLLYKSYMTFVQGGGIYFFSDNNFRLGDALTLNLDINIDRQNYHYTLPVKIVWKSSGMKKKGFGAAFGTDEAANTAKINIELLLEGLKNSKKRTFTM